MRAFITAILLISTAVAQEQQEKSVARYLRAQSFVAIDPKTVELKDDSDQQVVSRRTFVRYESSKWEQIWLDNVDRWATEKTICEELNTPAQMKYMHDFLTLLCSARYEAPYNNWCIIDDGYRPLWYNTADRTKYDLSWVRPVPASVSLTTPFQPVIPGPEHEEVVSKMVFRDDHTGEEYNEYIEPLVSHLRFPLCKCASISPIVNDDSYHWFSIAFKGYIIPPPPALKVGKKYLFDAGASRWSDAISSLRFFYDTWKLSGHVFDEIFAYEYGTTAEDFYKGVPDFIKDHVHYQQCAVVSTPEEEKPGIEPFLPLAIKKEATAADYVFFKLDIDQPKVEHGTIDFILNDPNNFIDEIAFEHHIAGNYLMPEWGTSESMGNTFSLRDSYELFLKLRQKGIRSHSWI